MWPWQSSEARCGAMEEPCAATKSRRIWAQAGGKLSESDAPGWRSTGASRVECAPEPPQVEKGGGSLSRERWRRDDMASTRAKSDLCPECGAHRKTAGSPRCRWCANRIKSRRALAVRALRGVRYVRREPVEDSK